MSAAFQIDTGSGMICILKWACFTASLAEGAVFDSSNVSRLAIDIWLKFGVAAG